MTDEDAIKEIAEAIEGMKTFRAPFTRCGRIIPNVSHYYVLWCQKPQDHFGEHVYRVEGI